MEGVLPQNLGGFRWDGGGTAATPSCSLGVVFPKSEKTGAKNVGDFTQNEISCGDPSKSPKRDWDS